MKTIFLIILLVLSHQAVTAQNLVPNPGFELYNNCPTDSGQIPHPLVSPAHPPTVNNWFSATPYTADYYNTCGTGAGAVPLYYWNGDKPHTGNGAAAFYILRQPVVDTNNKYSEYLETPLTDSLITDEIYQVSCYIKPTHIRLARYYTQWFVSSIAVCFTKDPVFDTGFILRSDTFQMRDTTGGQLFYGDLNWIKISTTFRAKGGEKYLTIGYFENSYSNMIKGTDACHPGIDSCINRCYYMIDDVTVMPFKPCDTVSRIHDSVLCRKGNLPASLSSTISAGDYYKWSTGHTTKDITISKGGTYWCKVLHGCHLLVDTYRIYAHVDTIRKEGTSRFDICEDNILVLATVENGETYEWSNGETTRNIEINKSSHYTCYISKDCRVFIEEFNVFVHPTLKNVNNPVADTIICKPNTLTIGKQYHPDMIYRWNTGDTVCCITPAVSGNYSLTISSKNCGMVTDSGNIVIENCPDCIFIPGAFTPNNDGHNDIFRMLTSCRIDKFTMRIFNRWGQEVFYTTDPRKGWNGMHGADIADVGTYFYLVEYTSVAAGKAELLKGDVLLLR